MRDRRRSRAPRAFWERRPGCFSSSRATEPERPQVLAALVPITHQPAVTTAAIKRRNSPARANGQGPGASASNHRLRRQERKKKKKRTGWMGGAGGKGADAPQPRRPETASRAASQRSARSHPRQQDQLPSGQNEQKVRRTRRMSANPAPAHNKVCSCRATGTGENRSGKKSGAAVFVRCCPAGTAAATPPFNHARREPPALGMAL